MNRITMNHQTNMSGAVPVDGDEVPDEPVTVVPPQTSPSDQGPPPGPPLHRQWHLLFSILCCGVLFATFVLHLWAKSHNQSMRVLLAEHCRFDETSWRASQAYHTMVTHAIHHRTALELGYSILGVLVFGWLVQRNIGFWRTTLLFVFCAAMSVGVWLFILTPFGQEVLNDMVAKAFRYLAERFDLGVALVAHQGYQAGYQRVIDLHGPLHGASGAIAGLMMFTLIRRTRYEVRVPIKWITLLLIVGYTALGWGYLYPEVLRVPTPYLWWVGGAVGGWIFCLPDKALGQIGDSFANAWVDRQCHGSAA